MTGRECKGCGEYKPWSNYTKDKHGLNGYRSRCKACMKINRTKYDYSKYLKTAYEKMRGGVYMITTRAGLYIGESGNLDSRLYQHTSTNKYSPCFGKEVLQKEVLEYIEDPVLRLQREKYYINKLKPTLNSV